MGTIADVIEELIMACIKKSKAMFASDEYESLQDEIDGLKECLNCLLTDEVEGKNE